MPTLQALRASWVWEGLKKTKNPEEQLERIAGHRQGAGSTSVLSESQQGSPTHRSHRGGFLAHQSAAPPPGVWPTRHPRDSALPTTTRRRRKVRKCPDSKRRERPRPAVQVVGSWVRVRGLRGQGIGRRPPHTGQRRSGSAVRQPPSAGASYLLAVEMARNLLPPRTTSVWPHSASPAELAMGPPAPSLTCNAQRPFCWRRPVTSLSAAPGACRPGACAQGVVCFDVLEGLPAAQLSRRACPVYLSY